MNKKRNTAKRSLPENGPEKIHVDKNLYLHLVKFEHETKNAAASLFGFYTLPELTSQIVERGRLHVREIFNPETGSDDIENIRVSVEESLMVMQSEIDFIGDMYRIAER